MSGQKPARTLKAKEKSTGLSPRRPVPLNTIGNVRTEMGRLYRLWLAGKIESDEMTKGTYALKEIRGCCEAELLDDVQARLSALAAKVEARRGH